MTSQSFAPDVLENIADLNDDDEKNQEFGVLTFVARDVEEEERRGAADTIDADHQAPLDFGGALKEMVAIARNRASERHEQERADGYEKGKEPIAMCGYQIILQRCDDEKDPEQGPVIAKLRRRERDKLAQSQK